MHTLHHLLRPRREPFRPPAEADQGFFGAARRVLHENPVVTDGLLAAGLFVVCTIWLVDSSFGGIKAGLIQAALIAPLVWRRSYPTAVFLVIVGVALFEWIFGPPLLADAALLVALYTVAVHESRGRALAASAILEVGAILAATRWHPAGTLPRSLGFLTATVVAALFAGLTVRSGSEYMGWLAERATRLEVERDQQASLAAAEERTRIAREMHDIVAHSLSVVVTLVDAASVVNRSDPDRAADAMHHASAVGRQALGDMRTLIGVLRTDAADVDLLPQPGLAQLDELLDRVRATGLEVDLAVDGQAFTVGPAVELSVYRIVQESLTNTIKHASATRTSVTLRYDRPLVRIEVSDNGTCRGRAPEGRQGGGTTDGRGDAGVDDRHGIDGMRERAALHGGHVEAGPAAASPGDGWMVTATLRADAAQATA